MEICHRGWDHPTKVEGNVTILKPEIEWTLEESTAADYNSKALNTTMTSLEESQYNLITGCTQAKEACEILWDTYERTSDIKETKMQ